jgi:hypothetical protein
VTNLFRVQSRSLPSGNWVGPLGCGLEGDAERRPNQGFVSGWCTAFVIVNVALRHKIFLLFLIEKNSFN